MADLNWDLAQVPNLFTGAVRAQQAGQLRRDEQTSREALALYGQNPEAGINALRPVDPETAFRLERQRKEQRDRALGEQRENDRRRALTMATDGDFTGAQQAAGGDADTIRAIREMSDADHKKAQEKASVMAGILMRAEKMTPEQAEDFKRSIAPQLVAGGYLTQEQIDGFRMTPENIAFKKAEALGVAGLLEQDWKERELKIKADNIAADNLSDQNRLGIQQQNADAATYRAHKPPAPRGGGKTAGRVLGKALDPNDGW